MALRAAALEVAHRSYLPSRNDEAWRFTDPSALYQLAFAPAPVPASPSVEAIAPFVLPEAGQRLVFADGAFVPSLSTTVATERLFIGSLAEALVHPSFPTDSVRSNLGRIADFKARHGLNLTYIPFVALATMDAISDWPILNALINAVNGAIKAAKSWRKKLA